MACAAWTRDVAAFSMHLPFSVSQTQALHSGVDASMDHSSQASRTTSSNVAQGTVLGIVWTTSLVFGVMYVAVGRLWPRYWRGNEEVASFRSNPLQVDWCMCGTVLGCGGKHTLCAAWCGVSGYFDVVFEA